MFYQRGHQYFPPLIQSGTACDPAVPVLGTHPRGVWLRCATIGPVVPSFSDPLSTSDLSYRFHTQHVRPPFPLLVLLLGSGPSVAAASRGRVASRVRLLGRAADGSVGALPRWHPLVFPILWGGALVSTSSFLPCWCLDEFFSIITGYRSAAPCCSWVPQLFRRGRLVRCHVVSALVQLLPSRAVFLASPQAAPAKPGATKSAGGGHHVDELHESFANSVVRMLIYRGTAIP